MQQEEDQKNAQGDESSFWEPAPQQIQQAPSGAPAPGKRSVAKRICAVVLAVLLMGIGAIIGWLATYYSTDPRIRELQWMLGVLESEHYQDVDIDEVYGDIYDAVMPDIFSSYYTPDEYELIIEQSQGVNRGIGVTLARESDGSTLLYTVVENSPAQLAGLRKGMYLLGYSAVGEEMQTGTTDDILAFISAQEGEFCLYAGYEKDASQASAYTMQREVYHAGYCVYRDGETSYALRDDPDGGENAIFAETYEPLEGLDDSTAYIRLDSFDGQCAQEFAYAMQVMQEQGRTNLILDLRGNGGGYLSDLQMIASYFTKNTDDTTPVVAYAQYRDGMRINYTAQGNYYDAYFTEDSQITVLADEGSASASECLIGAMIDYGAIDYSDIYLRKDSGASDCATYGKGVMQSMFTSPQGGVFQLTVARIYWPVSGKCIHGTGVRESDGANGVVAPYLPSETDVMLESVLASVCS